MVKNITVLGSTGSIGTQTLDICRRHGFRVKALSAGSNVRLLEEQAREFRPLSVCAAGREAYNDLRVRLGDTDIKVLYGGEGLCELARTPCDMTVNAVVGMAGFLPTLAAIEAGNPIGLANKETMVVGGELVTRAAREKNVPIIPIDSEHSAIFQSLRGSGANKIEKILLTASGGPFFGYTPEMLKAVTIEQALSHPNWSMGRKITVDSATLMNKGLELIEAVWLFGVSPGRVEVVVHRQSVIHSAVEFEDGAVIAQLGVPDMRLPIQYALTYPERLPCPCKRLSLFDIGTLTFERPDEETFTCLALAKRAIGEGGNSPCILNCANEAAVAAFLSGRIPFYRIPELVGAALSGAGKTAEISPAIISETEKAAREAVEQAI